MLARHDVVVTGMGIITPLGLNAAELLSSLQANRSGIGLWESPLLTKKLPFGQIKHDFSDAFTKLELPYLDRVTQLAIFSARQALRDAGLDQFGHYGPRAGIFYGTVNGGITTEHEWVRQFFVERKEVAKPFTIMSVMPNAAPAQLSIRHQIRGPAMTHSSACSSSGAAIGEALRAIRHGYVDVALVGGSDSAFGASFLSMWGGLRALADVDPHDVGRSCRPFSADRTGLVISEGAVFFVLESREHAQQRGAGAYCTLSGYGIGSDAYHIGSPDTGGQVATLQSALADAELRPEQIGYINAHATGTRGGDPVEAAAIREAFGDSGARVPVSSTKGIHGHLLGAASAMELAVAILAITESFLPATAHLERVDPNCPLNHVAEVAVLDHPVNHALSFSTGFGGTNVALIASRERALPNKRAVQQVI
jgi:3-oxoacyl-(acyl-carrier-protein) synthase